MVVTSLTVEPEPEISFRALVGSLGPCCFTMLIDTGSSHNYLQPRVANYFHLPVDRATHFTVAVGNGEKIQSEGTCRNISFDMQGTNFEADFHILESSDADTVLGVQWLERLGKIVTDYKKLTMEFEHKGQPILLARNQSASIQPVTHHQLMRLQQVDAVSECFLLML